MNDVHPKFIIQDDEELGLCLIIARCTFHKELSKDVTKVKGGGLWDMKRDTMTITLSGSSHDFGSCRLEDIQKCIESGNIYSSSYLHRKYDDNFNFIFLNQSGTPHLLYKEEKN